MEHQYTTGNIATILRNTLRRLEQGGAFKSNDPALIHLKRRLLLSIAELEMQKDLKFSAKRQKPVFVLLVRKSAQPKPGLEFCSLET